MDGASADLPSVYVRPGQVHAATAPTRVVTVLGSCVAVTLYSPERRLGALCHAMLPSGPPDDLRFVDSAVDWLVGWFARQGVGTAMLEAKLFGGGDMFITESDSGAGPTVGQQNIRRAREHLQAANLRPLGEDVGGLMGRKLLFFTATGDVYVKRNPVSRPEPART